MKRLIDLGLAACGVALLLPTFAVVSLLVKYQMGSPVFFRQKRVGHNGRVFELIKFRTMTDERDPAGRLLPDEQRLTGLGRLLRRWSLDEFPQLLNIIRGDMSLVGPRPLLPEHVAKCDREQARRHAVMPGLTGWAQVNGRNAVSFEERVKCDLWYVDNHNLPLDIAIIARTVLIVLRGHGVHHQLGAPAPFDDRLAAEPGVGIETP